MEKYTSCPGSLSQSFAKKADKIGTEDSSKRVSHLTQWPVQFHLVSPQAPYFQGADLLLSADCVAYALADFHKDYLKDHSLIIACPKLDDGQEIYLQKLVDLIDQAKINTLTVMIMQVPCCMGLVSLAKQALAKASRKIPIKASVVSIQGEILNEEWL